MSNEHIYSLSIHSRGCPLNQCLPYMYLRTVCLSRAHEETWSPDRMLTGTDVFTSCLWYLRNYSLVVYGLLVKLSRLNHSYNYREIFNLNPVLYNFLIILYVTYISCI